MVVRGWRGVRGLQGRVTANGVEVSLLGDGSDLNGLWRGQHKGHTLTAPELYKGFECVSCVACELNCSRAIKKKSLGFYQKFSDQGPEAFGSNLTCPSFCPGGWGNGVSRRGTVWTGPQETYRLLGRWLSGAPRSRPSMQPQESGDKAEARSEGKQAPFSYGSLQLPVLLSEEGVGRPQSPTFILEPSSSRCMGLPFLKCSLLLQSLKPNRFAHHLSRISKWPPGPGPVLILGFFQLVLFSSQLSLCPSPPPPTASLHSDETPSSLGFSVISPWVQPEFLKGKVRP